MQRIYAAARDNGYLADVPLPVSEEDVGYLPREEVLLLVTGSQGEARSALWRIANDENARVVLEEGDAVIFSSRIIPGNDTAIFKLQNQLVRKGIEIITDDDHFIHVSGHPARDELTQMYQWVRPRIAVPVHGEARHLAEHARLARECQVPEQIVGENGALIRLAPGPAEIVDHVPTGRLAVDGYRLLPVNSPVLRARQKMGYNGAATVTLVIGADNRFQGEPIISAQGLLDEAAEADKLTVIAEGVIDALKRLPAVDRRDDELRAVLVAALVHVAPVSHRSSHVPGGRGEEAAAVRGRRRELDHLDLLHLGPGAALAGEHEPASHLQVDIAQELTVDTARKNVIDLALVAEIKCPVDIGQQARDHIFCCVVIQAGPFGEPPARASECNHHNRRCAAGDRMTIASGDASDPHSGQYQRYCAQYPPQIGQRFGHGAGRGNDVDQCRHHRYATAIIGLKGVAAM